MMNQQPDKLFRDKLEGYQKQAPASAWDRIDAGLAKNDKKPVLLWYRVAAAVLLLAVAAFLLWPRGNANTSPEMISKKTTPAVGSSELKEKDQTEKPVIAETTTPGKKDDAVIKDEIRIRKQNKTKSRPVPMQPERKAEQVREDVQVAMHDEEKNRKENSENTIIEESSVAAVQPPVEKTSLTLIITANEVNDKYLDKEALAQATSEKKKSSTFKKLLEKAQDLKNNQDPFGDLRQKKNEILALNFKNDKRGQNK